MKNGKNLWQSKEACGYNQQDLKEENDFMEQPEDIKNPVVMKVIHETRKVVNAIIRKYGKPNEIRIEMARDLKESEQSRKEYQKAINKNKKINEDVEKTLIKNFKEFSEHPQLVMI